jgi:DNA invertase Pin-like site-specific DNA recombinase
MPRRSYNYSRVSDPRQAREGRDGLRRQDSYAQQLSAENGWCLDDSLVFIDKGRSGFHGDNLKATAALACFLDAIRTGRVAPGSVLIIENIDRLSRQEVDVAYDLFRSIIKAGVWIATKTPPRIYKKESNSFMDLMEPIWLMYLAHMESKKKSERIGDQWQTRRKNAREAKLPHGGLCPAWLSHGTQGYTILEGPANTIRTIHRLAQEGLGLLRILRWLDAHAVEHPPFAAQQLQERWNRKHPDEPRTYPQRWTGWYVQNILRDRAVIGYYQPHTGRPGHQQAVGEPIPGYYPAVITEDEWLRTQAMMDGRRRAAGRPGAVETNLFTGLVLEANSRERLSCTCASAGDGKRMRIYRYLANTQKAGGIRFAYDQFEAGILRRIGQFTERDVLPSAAAADAREARIGKLQDQLRAIDQRMDMTSKDYDAEDDPEVRNRLKASLRRQAEEKRAVAKDLERLKLESATGLADALKEAKSIIAVLDEARGKPQEESLRRRLKVALRWLVDEVWLVVQPVHSKLNVGHAQIYLRGVARPRYVQLLPLPPRRLPDGFEPWHLGACDFRAGDVGHAARGAKPGQLVG